MRRAGTLSSALGRHFAAARLPEGYLIKLIYFMRMMFGEEAERCSPLC
jgi:hypothetical protein